MQQMGIAIAAQARGNGISRPIEMRFGPFAAPRQPLTLARRLTISRLRPRPLLAARPCTR